MYSVLIEGKYNNGVMKVILLFQMVKKKRRCISSGGKNEIYTVHAETEGQKWQEV